MPEFKSTNKNFKARFESIASAIAGFLLRLGVTATALTSLGLILGAAAGLVYSTGAFFWGGCLVLLSGVCDALDGPLARRSGKASRLGAFLDSVFDRVGEIFIFLGLIWYFSGKYVFNPPDGFSAEVQTPIAAIFAVLAIVSGDHLHAPVLEHFFCHCGGLRV